VRASTPSGPGRLLASPSVPGAALVVAVGVVLFTFAFENGGFNLTTRSVLGIAVWWGLGIAVVLRLWPLEPVPRGLLLVGGLLAALTAWTALSVLWSDSAERAFREFGRASLLLGVFFVGGLGSSRRTVARWTDGMALGITAVVAVALASRFFGDLFSSRGVVEFLPAWQVRLAFPVGYWNGLAILVALAIPLLLRVAASPGHPLVRGAAVAPLPAIAAVVYLASSRGGVATAVVGLLTFVAAAPRRWAVLGAGALGAGGAGLALLALSQRDELVNGPLAAPVVDDQGRGAALLVTLACAAVGLAWAGVAAQEHRLPAPPRWAGRALAAGGALITLVAVVAWGPTERFDEFRQPPGALAAPTTDFVEAHLMSANGSGRWQLWQSAVDEWEANTVIGGGAGSYEAWWAQHGTLALFVRDAHSIYLETLGELGVVGFGLLGLFVATALAVGVRRVVRSEGEQRMVAAALLAVVAAFLVSVAVDWMWELTVVSSVGMLALGLLVGPGTAGLVRAVRVPFGVGVALVLAAWGIVCAQAVLLLGQVQIDRSRDANTRGDTAAALERARSARTIEPWAASPRLQLALVYERMSRLPEAREAIAQAIDRDPTDWRLWYTRTRLETRAGDVPAARRSLRRATELNPRSPLFAE